MNCPNCNAPYTGTPKYCNQCRFDLASYRYRQEADAKAKAESDQNRRLSVEPCPSCGTKNRIGAPFCSNCGIEIQAAKLAGERESKRIADHNALEQLKRERAYASGRIFRFAFIGAGIPALLSFLVFLSTGSDYICSSATLIQTILIAIGAYAGAKLHFGKVPIKDGQCLGEAFLGAATGVGIPLAATFVLILLDIEVSGNLDDVIITALFFGLPVILAAVAVTYLGTEVKS